MRLNTRGIVQVWILYVVGAAALTQLVPNWRPSHWFQKGPETKQLAQAQADLDKAKLEAVGAEAKYQAALLAQKEATTSQLRFSQQFASGIPPLLAKAPQTPEIMLAQSFAGRVNKGLALAIGDLPEEKQAEILQIIEAALSAKQAEIDAANKHIAELDSNLAATTKAKLTIEAQLPAILKAKEAAEAKVEVKDAVVNQKTAEVAKWANDAREREKENGSLGALVQKLCWVVGIIAVLYLYVKFTHLSPGALAEYKADLTKGVDAHQALDSVTSRLQQFVVRTLAKFKT